MTRSLVTLRCATPADAPALAELWGEVLRRADDVDRIADLVTVIERAATADGQRLVVAEYDGEVAGAVHLHVSTLTPINLEPIVFAVSPHVFPQFRRHGVGTALIDAAVSYAEERGIGHVATGAAAGSRDANRFMARLSWAPRRSCGSPPPPSCVAGSRPSAPRCSAAATGRDASSPRCWPLAARCGAARRRRRWAASDTRPARADQPVNRSRGISAQVIREVQSRRPCSSEMTTS